MTWALRISAVLAGTLVPLVLAEILLRLHPASHEGTRTLPVDDRRPIARLEPNREFTWSRDWNFSIVNTVQVNNAGFVSDVDYDPDAPGPLLAVIGDSYVEAAMVPFRRTCAGRLATMLEPAARVYAFGLGGAPLSQYLSWAAYARDAFRPNGLIVIVIENDYDQSLIEYHRRPGFHHFVERDDGRLALERVDFSPSLGYRLAQRSALARYLAHNLQGLHSARRVLYGIMKIMGTEGPGEIRYGAPASGAPARVDASKRAVDAFLDLLPEYSGLEPERIVFVVDGMRPSLYDAGRLDAERGSFRGVMRRYFMANAGRKGYETIDMQPRFIAHHREHRQRFEWPQDRHWNALGHERCFEAVAGSKVLTDRFPRP